MVVESAIRKCLLTDFLFFEKSCIFAKNIEVMGYIIKINSESSIATNLINYLKTFDFVTVTKEKTALAKPATALNPQQEKFKKKFAKALQEVKDIRAGKKKARNLDEVLNEL